MLTGICNKTEVIQFLSNWLEREYPIIDDDDELMNRLILASADDIVSEDVDYWANQSVKMLYQQAKSKLLGE